MPKKKIQKVHINVTIDEDLNEWLEKTAGEYRMNKSQVINNLISMGKKDVGLLKATGALGLARAVIKVKEEFVKISGRGTRVKATE
ncbi:MAG: hypothetical protein WCO26_20185 [Deltaproteobacteria bacterium]